MKKSTVKVLFMALGMFVLSACSEDLANDGGVDDPNRIPDDATHFEKLETLATKIESPTKNLGDVQLGSPHSFKIKVTNKKPDVPMRITIQDYRNFASYVDMNVEAPCTNNGLIFTQPASSSCEITFNLVLDNSDNEGSPFILYIRDRNDTSVELDNLAVVVYYNLK